MCFEQDMRTFLRYYKRPELKATSYDSLFRTAENYVYPVFGKNETSKLTSFDVIDLIQSLKDSNYSLSTQKKVRSVLNMFFEYAVKENLASKNIVSSVICKDPGHNIKPIPKSFSISQIKMFQRTALQRDENGDYISYYGPLLIAYLHTGCRLGELLAVNREEDFDSKNKKIIIHSDIETVSNYDSKGNRLKGCQNIKQPSPKTKSSNREIYLNTISYTCLNYYYGVSLRCGSEALIPAAKNKKKFASPSSIQNAFYSICKRAGIKPNGGIHTLRHSYATHLIKNKEDIKMVSRMLGHQSVKITLDTYYHLFEEEVTQANTILDTVFAF